MAESTEQLIASLAKRVRLLETAQRPDETMPRGRVASVAVTSPHSGIGTSATDVAGAVVSFTADDARRYRVQFQVPLTQAATAATAVVRLTTAANALLQTTATPVRSTYGHVACGLVELVGLSGPVELKLRALADVGTINIANGVGQTTTLLVEDIGLA